METPPPPINLPTGDNQPQGLIVPPAPPEMPKQDASYGALISIVIILAIIVVGAFYSWGKRIQQNGQVIQLPDATTTAP